MRKPSSPTSRSSSARSRPFPKIAQVADQLTEAAESVGTARLGVEVAAQSRRLPAHRRISEQRKEVIDGVLSGRRVREDPERVDAHSGIGEVNDHQILDVGERALVFARLAGIEDMYPGAQREPSADQQLADVGLAAAR